MEVFVFKTNIRYKKQLPAVSRYIEKINGIARWNVDFDDKDKILRVEASNISPRVVEHTLEQAGYYCEELE